MKMSCFAMSAALMAMLHAAPASAQDPALADGHEAAVEAAPLPGSPTGIEAARDIRRNGLSVGLYQGFFSPIGVYRDGVPLDIGIFGGDAARYFDDSALVAAHLRDYRRQKIAGVTLWSTGLAALVADIVIMIAQSGNRTMYHDGEALYWSLLGGGVATGMIGAVVMNSANHSLEDAVNAHNADILNKYLPAAERSFPVLR